MRETVVVIDPGHGGEISVGGSSPNRALGPNGLREKDLTLDLARRVRSLLSAQVRVVLTRDDDRNLSLTRRAGIARENDAAVFLSLHFDGAPHPFVDRTQAWIARNATASTRRFAESVGMAVARAAGIAAAAPAQRNLGLLVPERHGPNTRACLLEIAYLTNRSQASRLERDPYRQEIAVAIAKAVEAHLGESAASALDTPKVVEVDDEALDNKQAMIYPPNTLRKTVPGKEDLKDIRAVWTYCPQKFNINEPEVFVFFHGNHHFVAAKKDGADIKPRKPKWAPERVKDDHSGKFYKLDQVDGLVHQPIELLPETGIPNGSGDQWCIEPGDKLLRKDALGDFINDCLDRLNKLTKPSGTVKYLSKRIQTADLKRLFVMGHSGGTETLNAAASNTIVLEKPTDLVSFDRSYGGEDVTPYFNFCKHWHGKKLLGNGVQKSRFVAVYLDWSPNMGPSGEDLRPGGDTLLHRLTKPEDKGGLGLTCNTAALDVTPRLKKGATAPEIVWPEKDVIYIRHRFDETKGNLDSIREALKRDYKAIFIITNVSHEIVPAAFTPLILDYKRNP